MNVVRAVVLLAAISAASCGTPLLKLPTGPGEPAADAASLLSQATSACSRVASLSVEVAVRGSVDGSRTRGRLLVGVAGTDGMYIEAPAPFGAPVFILGASGGAATLLLPRDRRVVEHASAGELLQAMAGVPLDGPALRTTLTGCPAPGVPAGEQARRFGENWRVIDGAATLYLKRDKVDAPWHLVSALRPGADGWRTDYSNFVDGLPRAIRLVSNTARRFDLRLELSQEELNPSLDPATFRVSIPSGTQSVSLEELRAGGPVTK
ncbi:MAG: hypothetical protein U0Q11_24590 [Vicinamibacterales bacterium]